MDITVEINALKELLTEATSTVILLPESASQDAIAAGLSLYLSLKQLQKTVTIAYPNPPIVGWSHLVGLNKLTQKLGTKNFVISLDYTEGAIEKVSYNIDGNKFNLVIEPREGAPLINEKNVSFNYSGFNATLIVTIEAVTLNDLGKYYKDNQTVFTEKPIIVIDNRAVNNQYGRVNFVRPAATISEIMAYILKEAEMPLDNDIASNLFNGLVIGSKNFASTSVSADTFEAAAFLLKHGARKKIPYKQEELPQKEVVTSKSLEAPQAPPDWFKPKIYKGSTLL